MKPRPPRFAVAAAAVGLAAAVLSLAGCNSTSPEENVSQACTEADSLAGAVEDFRSALTSEATVEEVRSARDTVIESYETLMTEAQDVAQDRMDELESSVDEFRSSVDDVPDDTAVPEAIESLRSEASEVRTALGGLEAELTC